MVGLAVPDAPSPAVVPEDKELPLPLRTHAIWYPNIPTQNLHLHDDSYAGKAVSSAEYLPVVHTVFGGPSGFHLKYLTRITAVCSHSTIVGLEFSYDSKGSPIRHQQLYCSTNSKDLNRINFHINGPGGELIAQVQVGYAYHRNKNDIGGPQRIVNVTSLVVSFPFYILFESSHLLSLP